MIISKEGSSRHLLGRSSSLKEKDHRFYLLKDVSLYLSLHSTAHLRASKPEELCPHSRDLPQDLVKDRIKQDKIWFEDTKLQGVDVCGYLKYI